MRRLENKSGLGLFLDFGVPAVLSVVFMVFLAGIFMFHLIHVALGGPRK